MIAVDAGVMIGVAVAAGDLFQADAMIAEAGLVRVVASDADAMALEAKAEADLAMIVAGHRSSSSASLCRPTSP